MATDLPQKSSRGDGPDTMQLASKPATRVEILLLGLGLVALFFALIYVFLSLWPAGPADDKANAAPAIRWVGTNSSFSSSPEARLLLLIMVTGALGSFIHTATSFSDFVGNQKLSTNWVWWYILRPFIGAALAALFYVTIRAGFLTTGGESAVINLYGVTAMAGMVGMFAKQATDKLSEVFDTLFKTAASGGDAQRKDALANALPVITAIEPATLSPSNTSAVLTVRGSGFAANSVVRVRDADRSTEFKNAGELSVILVPDDLRAAGSLDLVVFTPPPGGGRSLPASLQIAAP